MKAVSLFTHESLPHAYIARMDDGSWKWITPLMEVVQDEPDPEGEILDLIVPAPGEEQLLLSINRNLKSD